MTDQVTPRQWHVRFKIDTTVKDGARIGEIVVSCDYAEGERPTKEDYLREAGPAGLAANIIIETINGHSEEAHQWQQAIAEGDQA
jgi:phosphoribosyl 1,2-cyclic phosphodiesterase